MDDPFYSKFFAEIPNSCTVSHDCIPCHNFVSPDILKHYSKDFLRSDNSKSVSESSRGFPFYKDFLYVTDFSTVLFPGSGLKDRGSELVVEKFIWNEKLSSLTPKGKQHDKFLEYLNKVKVGKAHEKNDKADKYLDHFRHDPEPYFEGEYNWLYTGGNITGFNMNDKYCLITGNESKNSFFMNLIELNLDDKEKFGEIIKRKNYLPHKDTLLQVSCCEKANCFIIAARERRSFKLMKINENYSFDCSWTNKIEHGIYISADLSAETSHFVTIDNFSEMTLHDMEREDSFLKQKYSFESGPWAQVMFSGGGNPSIFIATPDSMNVIDLRIPLKPVMVYKPKIVTQECESIYNVIRKNHNQYTFVVATSHKAIEMDIRTGKNTRVWTHLMTSPPQFGKSCYRKGEEIIILQSETPGEMIGILNEEPNDELLTVSNYNPYMFDSALEERRKAVLHGAGTHPAVQERLNFTITGIEIFKNCRDEPFIFTVNGGGDIILNKLRRRKDSEESDGFDISEESLKGFRKFEEHCVNLYANEIPANNEKIDMGGVEKIFNSNETQEMESENKEDLKNLKWRFAEMFTPQSLCYHEDSMAQKVLKVWKVEKRNIWDIDLLTDEERKKEEEEFQKAKKENIEKWIAAMEAIPVRFDF